MRTRDFNVGKSVRVPATTLFSFVFGHLPDKERRTPRARDTQIRDSKVPPKSGRRLKEANGSSTSFDQGIPPMTPGAGSPGCPRTLGLLPEEPLDRRG